MNRLIRSIKSGLVFALRVLADLASLLVLRLIGLLPFRWQLAAGRRLGRIAHRIAAKPRAIARRNIELCFPEKEPDERNALVAECFESMGMGLAEMIHSWWASSAELERACTITGLEHLQAARAGGRGVILMTAHFTPMELCSAMLSRHVPRLYGVYRSLHKNPILNPVIRERRARHAEGLIRRRDVRSMLRVLRKGGALWYAGDQLVRQDKRSEVIPFFGEPALANTGIVDLARLSGAAVVPYVAHRDGDAHYRIDVLPAMADLPSGDTRADLTRMTSIFEAHIARHPEQYLWARPRFGKRPEDYPHAYADLNLDIL